MFHSTPPPLIFLKHDRVTQRVPGSAAKYVSKFLRIGAQGTRNRRRSRFRRKTGWSWHSHFLLKDSRKSPTGPHLSRHICIIKKDIYIYYIFKNVWVWKNKYPGNIQQLTCILYTWYVKTLSICHLKNEQICKYIMDIKPMNLCTHKQRPSKHQILQIQNV